MTKGSIEIVSHDEDIFDCTLLAPVGPKWLKYATSSNSNATVAQYH
jgi:hypothetical protein